MSRTKEKLTLRQAAEGVASIVGNHLSKLAPEEQEARMQKLRKRASKAQDLRDNGSRARTPAILRSARRPR
jgi:DNA gyrase/topoisomerase IV subunit B